MRRIRRISAAALGILAVVALAGYSRPPSAQAWGSYPDDSVRLYATANGNYTALYAYPGTRPDWDCIDEEPPSVSDYLYGYSVIAYQSSSFVIQNYTAPPDTAVDYVCIYSKWNRAGAEHINETLHCGGRMAVYTHNTKYTSAPFEDLTTGTWDHFYNLSTNPNTGLNWTVEEINVMHIGADSKAGTTGSVISYERCDMMNLVVHYYNTTAPPAPETNIIPGFIFLGGLISSAAIILLAILRKDNI